ncbi:MAG: hypothetical protein COA44_11130 [Arcobacter sp.]|nr:MAG: hypothetical protein COA44_11130 [Arcobacter sp.]
MHIFNLNNKPYLIVSSKELLFRENNLDEQMCRIQFYEIKKISLEHRYNPQKELFVWLSIQTKNKNVPYLVQISLLNESLEETFSILNKELKTKLSLKLASKPRLAKLRTQNKGYKRLSFLSILLFLSLLLYHKYVFPPLDAVRVGSTQLTYQKPQGFCSTNLKVAYASKDKQSALVKNYCGLFGFWKLQDFKQVPLKHLKTEFESYSAKVWILASKKLINEKKYKKAIISIEKALYLEPENKLYQVLLSQTYDLKGDHKKALILAKTTVSQYPNFALAHKNIAFLYQNENNISAAYPHLQAFNRLDPNIRSYIALAKIQEAQNLLEEALSNYQKALVLSPNNTGILTTLGLAYWEKKEFSKAEKILQKAYTLEPKNPGYFLNYYEISLVTKASITAEQKEQFLQENKGHIQDMMIYDMLQIIEASVEGKDVLEAKKKWKEKYQEQELNWSFVQMRSWLEDSPLEIGHIQDIQKTLGFFIGYQQVYSLKFNTTKALP